jgi:molecular chaperone DnaK
LRRECTEAKEALSADTEVTIPVMLPGVSTRVRMVRTELEQLVAPAIAETVEAMRRACAAAGLRADELSAVLLAGGSSRIPLVAQQVSAALDRPVTVDADPKAVVASGAALSIAPVVVEPSTVRTIVAPVSPRRWSRRGLVIGASIAACLAALVATASTVGPDLLADGGTPVGAADTADLPREVVDRAPIGTPEEAADVDPWTGEPYKETTPPGPTRPGAEPAAVSPTELTPTPTTGGDRDAQIDGAPPSTETVSTTADPTTTADSTDVRGTTPDSEVPTTTPTDPPVTTTPEPTTTTPEPTPDPTTTTPADPPAEPVAEDTGTT